VNQVTIKQYAKNKNKAPNCWEIKCVLEKSDDSGHRHCVIWCDQDIWDIRFGERSYRSPTQTALLLASINNEWKTMINWTSFISAKLLSSLNITFLHTMALQCRYFWQMLSIFFITAAVSMGFLAAGRHGRSRSFCSRWQIVIVETLRWFSGCLFFNSTTVIDGYEVTSRFKSLYVSDEVRLGVSEPNILVYSVPDGNNTAGTFTDKLPPLRPQYFCQEQLRPTQRLTQFKIMSLSSPGPHIECLTLILANQI